MRELGNGSPSFVDGIRCESEFTQEEEEWFEAGEALMDRDPPERKRNDEEQINADEVERARQEIEQLEEPQKLEKHHDVHRQDDALQEQEREPSSLFSSVAEKVWQDTMYPTYTRVVRTGFASVGLFGGSIGLGFAETGGAFQGGLAGMGLAVGAFAAIESSLRRRRKVQVSPLMDLYKVYDTDIHGVRARAGEIHLSGKEGLKKLKDISMREKRQFFLTEVQDSLGRLATEVKEGDGRVRDLNHFFGVTEVFSRQELEQLGFTVMEQHVSGLEKVFRYVAKKMLRLHTMGWKGLFRRMKERPLYRIEFSREQLDTAVARSGQ